MMRMLLDHVACDGSGDKEMEKKMRHCSSDDIYCGNDRY